MIPVTIALGLINLSLAINVAIGSLVSDETPAAIDKAFRIYQLPQGLFLDLDRHDPVPDAGALGGARGPRRPAPHDGGRRAPDRSAADPERGADGGAGRAHHAARVRAGRLRRRGHRPDLDRAVLVVALAPVPGREPAVLAHLLPLQRPWATTALAGLNLLVNFGLALGALRAASRSPASWSPRWRDRGHVRGAGLDPARRAGRGGGRAPALDDAADARGGRAARRRLRHLVRPGRALGRSLVAQIVAVLGAIAAGIAVYAAAVWVLRVPEARRIRRLLVSRGRSGVRERPCHLRSDGRRQADRVPQPGAAAPAPLGPLVLARGRERDRPRVPGPRRQDARARALRARGRHPPRGEDRRAGRRADHRGGADGVHRGPGEALDDLVEDEGETLEALQAAIEPTGREAASEAVEHRLEHMIMRKQEQVDYLLRARRRR